MIITVAIYLSPLYVLVLVYFARRSLRWMRACHGIAERKWFKITVITVYTLLASGVGVAVLLPQGTQMHRAVKLVSNYWLGIFAYIIMFTAAADLLKLILRAAKKIPSKAQVSNRTVALTGGVTALLIAAMSIYGMANATVIHNTQYSVDVNKASAVGDLNIVLVADTHLGYSIGVPMVQKMVDKINAMNADVVCLAGDIFDNEYAALDNPQQLIQLLQSIKSKYGVYACWGNHDVEETILAGFTFRSGQPKLPSARMEAFLREANITLLADESVLVENAFYLAGRRDARQPGTVDKSRLTPAEITAGMDKTLPVIVIDHEPRELAQLAAAGVDLDLCGHTHAGQIFPANITIHLLWENAYGHLQKGNMHNIVTSGVGVFGPFMRTFTKSEVVQVQVHFTQNAD